MPSLFHEFTYKNAAGQTQTLTQSVEVDAEEEEN
jgi:hypothetical protein